MTHPLFHRGQFYSWAYEQTMTRLGRRELHGLHHAWVRNRADAVRDQPRLAAIKTAYRRKRR
ncbi:hypothetical protein ACIBH1_45320 [Nonomuraea sp. NPDC050663]|uniref:hypothetical protein n=1 Tax=Nonomuraea sp. NPDC050663 TaxID=3364370 RepID=UPI0037A70991